MKKIIANILLLANVFVCSAQKLPVNSSTYGKWSKIEDASVLISNDGKYIVYNIIADTITMTHLQNLQTKVDLELGKPWGVPTFTADSKRLTFRDLAGNLSVIDLQTNSKKTFYNILSFKSSPLNNVLIYLQKDSSLHFFNTKSKTEKLVARGSVSDYVINGQGTKLYFFIMDSANGQSKLACINLASGKYKYQQQPFQNVSNLTFDKHGIMLAFNDGENLFYLDSRNNRLSNCNLKRQLQQFSDKEPVNVDQIRWDKSGQIIITKLYGEIKKSKVLPESETMAKVDIWSYKDMYLPEAQSNPFFPFEKTSYTYCLSINDNKLIQIDEPGHDTDWDLVSLPNSNLSDGYSVLKTPQTGDAYWRPDSRRMLYLKNLSEGKKTLIRDRFIDDGSFISPKGAFLIYYDREQRSYFSYNVSSKISINISQNVPFDLSDNGKWGDSFFAEFGIAGWLKDDKRILVYDVFDIWALDPTGLEPPINLTKGYGRANQITFKIFQSKPGIFDPHQKLVLTAFNVMTKENGFYTLGLNDAHLPRLRSMGQYLYSLSEPYAVTETFKPLKAKNSDTYIIERMSATEPPNLFSTKDFESFTQITHIDSQKKFNWITSELATWKNAEGKTVQGILYKPENFDPHKKYPIIMYFYQKLSDYINAFIYPKWSNGIIDIPTYVSNGYLIFIPDIYYKQGDAGQSSANSILSARDYLVKKPFVDSNRMGVEGISFGGFEVNFLLTQTSTFKAAVSCAGFSDWVSLSGGLQFNGDSGKGYTENGQARIGVTLWQNRDAYIRNSPIFYADRITTPVLFMHNKADQQAPWLQSVELFTGLRRLGKPSWLLQYDGEGHGLGQEINKRDFTIRMQQFFDHYLKDAPEPRWMNESMPSNLKGKDLGFDLIKSTN